MADIFDDVEQRMKLPPTGRTMPEVKKQPRVVPAIPQPDVFDQAAIPPVPSRIASALAPAGASSMTVANTLTPEPPPIPSGNPAVTAAYLTRKAAETLLPPGLAPGSLNPVAGTSGLGQVAEQAGITVEKAAKAATERALTTHPLAHKFPKTTAAISTPVSLAMDIAAPMLRPSEIQKMVGGEVFGMGAKLGLKMLRESPAAAGVIDTIANIPKNEKGVGKIVMKHPEVAKPGYYRENIGKFAEAVINKIKDVKESAQRMFGSALEKEGAVEVIKKKNLLTALGMSLEEQGVKKTIPATAQTYKQIATAIKAAKGDTLTAKTVVQIRQIVGDALNNESLPKSARVELTKYYQDLNSLLREKAGVAQIAKADKLSQEAFEKLESVKQALGADPQTDLSLVKDAAKIDNKVKNLLKRGELESKATNDALEALDPRLAKQGRKLAAAGPDERLTHLTPQGKVRAATAVSMGAAGYAALKNPAAAGLYAILPAIGMALSPRSGGLAAAGVKALQTAIPTLPGSGAILTRIHKYISDKKKEGK